MIWKSTYESDPTVIFVAADVDFEGWDLSNRVIIFFVLCAAI